MRVQTCALALAALLVPSAPAHAVEDEYFGYTYGAGVPEKGETETEFWITDRRGKDGGHYDAQDYRLELEHGVTDRFAASAYLNLDGHHVRGLEPGLKETHRNFAFEGVSAEFRYNLLSPDKDGFGFTLYAEPGWSRIHGALGDKGAEYEVELKAILQKNFAGDRLVWAANFTFEPEWERDHSGLGAEWEKELKVEASTGLSYRVGRGFYAGLEARYASVYPDWTDGLHRETYALFAGPSVHYDAGPWWITATYLPQLVGSPSRGGSLALDEYERRELRLKIGFDL